jgi:hypothetical protein
MACDLRLGLLGMNFIQRGRSGMKRIIYLIAVGALIGVSSQLVGAQSTPEPKAIGKALTIDEGVQLNESQLNAGTASSGAKGKAKGICDAVAKMICRLHILMNRIFIFSGCWLTVVSWPIMHTMKKMDMAFRSFHRTC